MGFLTSWATPRVMRPLAEAGGDFNFVFDAAHRLGIAHGQQSADGRAFLLYEIEGDLDAAAVDGFEFVFPSARCFWNAGRTTAPRAVPSEKISSAVPSRISRRGRPRNFQPRPDQHDTSVAGEEHGPPWSCFITCSTLSLRAEKISLVSRI